MSLIERDVSRIAGFQIGRQPVTIAAGERRPHKLIAEPLTLVQGVNADEGKIPMGFRRAKASHLAENTCCILLNGLMHGTLHQSGKRFLIGSCFRRQPQGDTCKLTDPKRGSQTKRLHCKGPRKLRHVNKIITRVRPGPSRSGIPDESQHNGSKSIVSRLFIDVINGWRGICRCFAFPVFRIRNRDIRLDSFARFYRPLVLKKI